MVNFNELENKLTEIINNNLLDGQPVLRHQRLNFIANEGYSHITLELSIDQAALGYGDARDEVIFALSAQANKDLISYLDTFGFTKITTTWETIYTTNVQYCITVHDFDYGSVISIFSGDC